MAKILITGATGIIGMELSKHLVNQHELRLVGRDFSDFPPELKEKAEIVKADLIDPTVWMELLNEMEYVVQLAGEADQEADFYESLLDLNYKIPHNLFEAATQSKSLKRILFASSIHAVDAYPPSAQIKTTDPVRPSNLYGVSKVYLEALAIHHAYVNEVESIGIRIGDYKAHDDELPDQSDVAGMMMYLSSQDFNQLIDQCLSVELSEPFLLINAISNNTFPRLSLDEGKIQVGYQPKDNAFHLNGFRFE